MARTVFRMKDTSRAFTKANVRRLGTPWCIVSGIYILLGNIVACPHDRLY